MSDTELDVLSARRLRDAGLVWRPASGDRFTIDRAEMVGDVFTVSEMTITAHRFETGTVLGFNGTTEWALDSVALEDALWLPREDQLRRLLGGTFRSLSVLADAARAGESAGDVDAAVGSAAAPGSGAAEPRFEVTTLLLAEQRRFAADTVVAAYAAALLPLLDAALSDPSSELAQEARGLVRPGADDAVDGAEPFSPQPELPQFPQDFS